MICIVCCRFINLCCCMYGSLTFFFMSFYVKFSAWAERRGYKTAKAARNDVYRAANSLLRLAVDGRLCLCLRPPGYSCLRGKGTSSAAQALKSGTVKQMSFLDVFICGLCRALGKSHRLAGGDRSSGKDGGRRGNRRQGRRRRPRVQLRAGGGARPGRRRRRGRRR